MATQCRNDEGHMLDIKIKNEILKCLKKEKLHKIILFGSHAYGIPREDSDIDLIVVSDNEEMSKNYRDFLNNKNKISTKLLPLKKKFPIDLIVYTRAEWEHLKTSNTLFIKNIEDQGIAIL